MWRSENQLIRALFFIPRCVLLRRQPVDVRVRRLHAEQLQRRLQRPLETGPEQQGVDPAPGIGWEAPRGTLSEFTSSRGLILYFPHVLSLSDHFSVYIHLFFCRKTSIQDEWHLRLWERVLIRIIVPALRFLLFFITLVAATGGILRSGADVPVRAWENRYIPAARERGRKTPQNPFPHWFSGSKCHPLHACFPYVSELDQNNTGGSSWRGVSIQLAFPPKAFNI